MDWLGFSAAVVAGIGSGALTGWLSRPAAQTKATEVRLKTEARRQLIADARRAVADAARVGLNPLDLGEDHRIMALRPHIDPKVAQWYEPVHGGGLHGAMRGARLFGDLLDEIDRLERDWKLV